MESLRPNQDRLVSYLFPTAAATPQTALNLPSTGHGSLQLLCQIIHLRLQIMGFPVLSRLDRLPPAHIKVLHVCQQRLQTEYGGGEFV